MVTRSLRHLADQARGRAYLAARRAGAPAWLQRLALGRPLRRKWDTGWIHGRWEHARMIDRMHTDARKAGR